MRSIIIIPARYESSRFPGKPLAMIAGKSLIRWVWERSVQALPRGSVYVATDDERIRDHCQKNGMQVLMTGNCLTGTDRVWQAAAQVDADVYLNVQGDEPLLKPSDILKILEVAQGKTDCIVNAMCPILREEDFRSVSVPKVVAAPDGRLLYISRAAIPTDKRLSFSKAMKQVCIYAFPKDLLERYGERGSKTPLETIEDIEILRYLEMGIPVHMVEVSSSSIAVDYPQDIMRVEEALQVGS